MIKKGDLVCRENGAVVEVLSTSNNVVHFYGGGFILFEDVKGWWRKNANGDYVRLNHEKILK